MEENNMANVTAKPKKKIYKKWWFWVLIAAVIVIIVSASSSGGDETPKTDDGGAQAVQTDAPKETEKEKEDLEVSDLNMTTDDFSTTITGKITNNTDKTYSYVQVTFSLYDSEGALLGTALANVNNLEGGGVWKFEAVGFEPDVASYKLTEITKF